MGRRIDTSVVKAQDYCWSCGVVYPSGTFHKCTTVAPALGGAIYTAKPHKDINWHEYTPAKPPEDGEYLVVVKTIASGKTETLFSNFDKANYSWDGLPSIDRHIVTHYVKIELP